MKRSLNQCDKCKNEEADLLLTSVAIETRGRFIHPKAKYLSPNAQIAGGSRVYGLHIDLCEECAKAMGLRQLTLDEEEPAEYPTVESVVQQLFGLLMEGYEP